MHHSSLSREITFLHFFSWNFISFGQKEPIKVQNFWLMTAHIKLHQICALGGSFRWNYIKFQLKKVWRIYITWHWKVIQNLKKSWFAVSKMKRVWWILFEVSNQISQNFPFDWFLFCKVPNICLKSVQRSYLTWHWREWRKNLKKKWPVVCKMIQGVCHSFTRALESVKIETLMGSFCPK